MYMTQSLILNIGTVHNCQHLNECTKLTFSDPPPIAKSVHINIFQIDNLPSK